MRRAFACGVFGIVIAAACGGRTTDSSTAAGSGGASGATGNGGTTVGGTTVGGTTVGGTTSGTGGGTTVGGTTVGGTTTGTGGGTVGGTGGSGNTGGSGGKGGAGGTGGVDYGACTGPGQCTVVPAMCCSCGILGVDQLESVNSSLRDAYTKQVCANQPPCPPCVGLADPNIMARCESGRCRKFDIRSDPTYTKCGTDQECTLRKGLECCQCGAQGDWVAISRVGEMLLTGQVCAPNSVCPSCVPVPPAGTSAVCRNGACTKVP